MADAILAALDRDPDRPPAALAERLLALAPEARDVAVARLLPDRTGRRWLREALLSPLSPAAAGALAERLLAFPADFSALHRDRTTSAVVAHLPAGALAAAAPFLAGSNAAAALWERLALQGSAAVVDTARQVLAAGEPGGRETTLSLLLVDRFPPITLAAEDRRALIALGLGDADEGARGIAAEVAAAEAPDLLLDAVARWVSDPGERVRMAAWAVAFRADPAAAADRAAVLVDDEASPLPVRRSALLALGEYLTTEQVGELLAELVMDPTPELAEDAAALLWSRHRSPVVAMAAARSPHEAVRTIAERLLHPTLGSPAAGGFRPGAADQGFGFYDQFRQEITRPRPGRPGQEP